MTTPVLPSDPIRQRAEELYQLLRIAMLKYVPAVAFRDGIDAIAAALRAARDEALEEAVKVADREAEGNELAATNPTSRTMAKCLPYMADDCRRIAAAIRQLKSKGGA